MNNVSTVHRDAQPELRHVVWLNWQDMWISEWKHTHAYFAVMTEVDYGANISIYVTLTSILCLLPYNPDISGLTGWNRWTFSVYFVVVTANTTEDSVQFLATRREALPCARQSGLCWYYLQFRHWLCTDASRIWEVWTCGVFRKFPCVAPLRKTLSQ
jgi:hypothetical protein